MLKHRAMPSAQRESATEYTSPRPLLELIYFSGGSTSALVGHTGYKARCDEEEMAHSF